jgi:hypothetical protein
VGASFSLGGSTLQPRVSAISHLLSS